MADLSYSQASEPVSITDESSGNQATVTATGALKTDGSAVTQPVSAASLPLPTGAATSANQTTVIANQTNATQKTQVVDGSGNVVTTTAIGTTRSLDSNVTQGPDGYAAQQNQVFSASFDFNLPNQGTETPALFLKNPNASGKTLVIKRILISGVSTANNEAVAYVYSNPTTSANGTAQTATTTSIGSGVTAVATPFSGPTASANGARLVAWQVPAAGNNTPAAPALSVDGFIRIAPNNTLLITGKPAANNMNVAWTIIWQEV